MKSKAQSYASLERYRAHMQQLGHTLKEFGADCGTEYFNKVVDAWCTQHRLHFTASAPYRHQGNGRNERYWQSLWNNIRASIADMSQDRDMWTYASNMCVYVRNAMPIGPQGQIMYQVVARKESDHTKLRVPFSAVYLMVEGVRRTTHDDKRERCIFIGYSEISPSYVCINDKGNARSRAHEDVNISWYV